MASSRLYCYGMTKTAEPRKLFIHMTDAELIDAYWWTRNTMATNSEMARMVNPRSRGGRILANQMGRLDRDWDIVNAVLRRRGINPLNHPPAN
jgi:hypothetical protein